MRSRKAVSIWCSEGIGFVAGLGAACLGAEWHSLGGTTRGVVAAVLVLGFSTLVVVRWRAGRKPEPVPPTVDRPVPAKGRTELERPFDRPPTPSHGAALGTRSIGSPSEPLKGASAERDVAGGNPDRNDYAKAAALSEAAEPSRFPDLTDFAAPRFATNAETRSVRFEDQVGGETSMARVTGDQLVEIWDSCRREGGDLIAELRLHYGEGIHSGQEVGAASYTVAVESGDPPRFFLLPEVGAAIRALGDYFAAAGGSATRLARVQRVIEPALVRRNPEGLEIERKGTVE